MDDPLDGWPTPCTYTWRWLVFDSHDSESCGDPAVACDVDTEEPRCAAHTADAIERENPYARRFPLRLVGV